MAETLFSVSEAKQAIQRFTRLGPVMNRSIGEATDFILAQDLFSPIHLPSFRQSSMDGYAFRWDDFEDKVSAIVGRKIYAGASLSEPLKQGELCRVFTGSPIPDGADTIVMQEKVSLTGNQVLFEKGTIKQYDHLREVGTEIKTGELVCSKGQYLSPAAIGFIASLGIANVPVFARPSVMILCTGNELVPVGQSLEPGKVYNSNIIGLKSCLELMGIQEIKVDTAPDDINSLSKAIALGLDSYDALILTGGVSVGELDLVTAVLHNLHVECVFHKVRQKPGKPFYFGVHNEIPVFALPGNPASALTCFYEYVEPWLQAWMGKPSNIKARKAILNQGYKKPIGISHFLRAKVAGDSVDILTGQESYRLSAYAAANALVYLPEAVTELLPGDEVEVHLLPFLNS
jgi:molybdopterin molybdotransferase